MGDLPPAEDEKKGGPVIFSLGLGMCWERSLFETTHGPLLSVLLKKSDFRFATTSREAYALFDECPKPHAVLVSDPGILKKENACLALKLVNYAKDGGTVVFGGLFPSGVDPRRLNCHFQHFWGLPWSVTVPPGPEPWPTEEDSIRRYAISGHGVSLARNCPMLEKEVKAAIPPDFQTSENANPLSNVARRDAWYFSEGSDSAGMAPAATPSPASAVLEAAFAAEAAFLAGGPESPKAPVAPKALDESLLKRRAAPDASTPTQTPIVYASVGLGHVGYVGDYQSENAEASCIVTLAMMKFF